MSRWNKRVPVNHDELRKWHEVVPGVSWRIVGTTIPTIEISTWNQYRFELRTTGFMTWRRAEARALAWALAFLAGLKKMEAYMHENKVLR